ncbi:ribonuclease VapC [Spirochaetia bacterium]|nr:ribonuclease VapC [Spirochaetia bacterium]
MKYLLDTNVLSELRKPNCDQRVDGFIKNINEEDIFTCALSVGEIVFGIEKLPEGKKKNELSFWLYRQILGLFEDRIIPLDTDVMQEWGRLCARSKRTLPLKDSFIAATALTHRCTLVTRNTKDFTDIGGLNLMNPWD